MSKDFSRVMVKPCRLLTSLIALCRFVGVLPLLAAPATLSAQVYPNVSGGGRSPVDIPQTNLTPIQVPTYSGQSPFPNGSSIPPSMASPPPAYGSPGGSTLSPPPGASLGSPLFDPYSSGPNPGTFAPAITGVPPISNPGALPPSGGLFSGSAFGASTPVFGPGNPGFGGPSGFGTPSGFGSPGYPSAMSPGGFPSSAYPSGNPSSLFPGGLFSGGASAGGNSILLGVPRFFQGPRIRHTWVNDGDSADSLETNDTDLSLVFAFPNFLHSNQPLYVVPSFGLHLLDGPAGVNGADLPPQTYDAFLDFGWQTDPNQILGADLGLRVGVFSDFETANSDSIRVLGKGLAVFRLTPFSTIRGGVYYLDRNRVKLLPAGGWLYQPTPFASYDFFFPQPKLSHYLTTLGTHDLWGYLAGEYGGGSWTVTRTSGREESVDINDIRAMLGLEWGRNELLRSGRRTGFFEFGVVFDREVLYRESPQNNFSPSTTFMMRLGLGY